MGERLRLQVLLSHVMELPYPEGLRSVDVMSRCDGGLWPAKGVRFIEFVLSATSGNPNEIIAGASAGAVVLLGNNGFSMCYAFFFVVAWLLL